MPDCQKQVPGLGFVLVLSLYTASAVPAHMTEEQRVSRIRELPCFCSNISNVLAAVVLPFGLSCTNFLP